VTHLNSQNHRSKSTTYPNFLTSISSPISCAFGIWLASFSLSAFSWRFSKELEVERLDKEDTAMRKPCCDKEGTNKGAWSKQEDQKLIDYIRIHGEGCWRSLPKAAGLSLLPYG